MTTKTPSTAIAAAAVDPCRPCRECHILHFDVGGVFLHLRLSSFSAAGALLRIPGGSHRMSPFGILSFPSHQLERIYALDILAILTYILALCSRPLLKIPCGALESSEDPNCPLCRISPSAAVARDGNVHARVRHQNFNWLAMMEVRLQSA